MELLVLSKMLRVPITVYQSQTEAQRSGGGFVPIARYGEEYSEQNRKPVHLLYRNGVLLVAGVLLLSYLCLPAPHVMVPGLQCVRLMLGCMVLEPCIPNFPSKS